jgi:hypothetical protein
VGDELDGRGRLVFVVERGGRAQDAGDVDAREVAA